MPNRTARPGEINGSAFDRFTLVHAASGAALGRLGAGLGTVVAAGIAWEFAERALKDRWPQAFPNPTQDTLQNAVVDVLAMASCAVIAKR